jgi:hypothetical protein
MVCEELESTVILSIPEDICTIKKKWFPSRLRFKVGPLFNEIPYSRGAQQAICVPMNVEHFILRILSKQNIKDPAASLELRSISKSHILVLSNIFWGSIWTHMK